MKLFVPLAMIVCVASAAPIGKAPPPDDTPLCGYVRMEEDAWWSVGLQTHGRCEPIWDNQTALIYRIDREGCGCAFFVCVGPVPFVMLLTGVAVMKRLAKDRATSCYTEDQSLRRVGSWKKRNRHGHCARRFRSDRETESEPLGMGGDALFALLGRGSWHFLQADLGILVYE
ncbi:hypothetical protein PMIN02_002597 [Paraphaeosphaeria minitans]